MIAPCEDCGRLAEHTPTCSDTSLARLKTKRGISLVSVDMLDVEILVKDGQLIAWGNPLTVEDVLDALKKNYSCVHVPFRDADRLDILMEVNEFLTGYEIPD